MRCHVVFGFLYWTVQPRTTWLGNRHRAVHITIYSFFLSFFSYCFPPVWRCVFSSASPRDVDIAPMTNIKRKENPLLLQLCQPHWKKIRIVSTGWIWRSCWNRNYTFNRNQTARHPFPAPSELSIRLDSGFRFIPKNKPVCRRQGLPLPPVCEGTCVAIREWNGINVEDSWQFLSIPQKIFQ